MEPINYLANMQDPFAQALSGAKLGAGLVDIRQQQQANQIDMQQKQQEMQQKQMYHQALQRLQSPKATAQDFRNVALFGSKDQGANLLAVLGNKTAEEKTNFANMAAPIASAFMFDNTTEGLRLLELAADAAENSQDIEDATLLRQQIEQVKADPKIAKQLGQIYATQTALVAPEMLDKLLAQKTDQRAEQLQTPALRTALAGATSAEAKAKFAEKVEELGLDEKTWNIKNLRSQISDRAAQLNLRAQEVNATVLEKLASINAKQLEIPPAAQALINDAAIVAGTSKQEAQKFSDLAKRLEAEGGGWGVFGSLADWSKSTLGFQGGMTGLRQEYTRLRNLSAMKSLPPGTASDTDVKMALQGFPAANSTAKDIASFLRGMAKLQDIDASVNSAKVDWLASNKGSLARAKNGFIAGDYAAKPGEAWVDFSQRITKDIYKKYAVGPEGYAPSLVDQIPTPRNPNPTPRVNDIRQQADAIIGVR